MNAEKYKKYIIPVLLVVMYLFFRIIYLCASNSIYETDFHGLAIAKSSFPFGIIKNSSTMEYFMPLYYLLLHIFVMISKSALFAKMFNLIISLANIFVLFNIGKYLSGKKTGILLAFLACINHFFLYYTNLIAPYCLNFLFGSLVIYSILIFHDNPTNKNFLRLSAFNCAFILCDTYGFLYVLAEITVLFYLNRNEKRVKKYVSAISIHSSIAFFCAFPFLITQYSHWSRLLIPESINGIGLNLSGLYLLINEYITPYLSFEVPDFQTQSTMGMLYSYFLTSDAKNINFFKILLTIFYSSILPIGILIYLTIKVNKNSDKLKIITLSAVLNLFFILIATVIGRMELNPIHISQFLITVLIILSYGIFTFSDNIIRGLMILCLVIIQFINPKINAFNITVKKNYATVNALNIFIKEQNITKDDLIIMPYMADYARIYYKKLNFYDFDYSSLTYNKNNGIIKNVNNRRASKINRENIYYLMTDYLKEEKLNPYLTKKFIEDFVENPKQYKRIVLFIDKANSRPISLASAKKAGNFNEYKTKIKKINFKDITANQNHQKILFDAIKSKTLYTYTDLLDGNFQNRQVIEYKKNKKHYIKLENKIKNSTYAINSSAGDYVFIMYSK